ncbi:MAG: TetR/AcrR family transcriptional regulator C-terminal domain-containing protein [Archangium sp.]|nr:TetR/AcrR family transcriptional regulator C-terminal domain-containing protein [Archangium sp.]
MGRISGALNHDHAEKRQRLASSLAQVILGAQGKHLSLKDLASAVKVDPGTLRHYFDDRAGAVRAAFESLLPHGEVQKARAAELATLPAKKGLTTLLERITLAWPHALGGMHAAGFVEGMTDPELGQAYVSTMLEPTIDAVERLLVAYHARGELQVPDARVGALALLSPVLIALFHQHQLSGRRCRPLDLAAFLPAHLEGFFRGYAPKKSLA